MPSTSGQIAYDARRSSQQSAKGNMWKKQHPEQAREWLRKHRALHGYQSGISAKIIDEQRKPLNVYSNNILFTSDYHIPYHDEILLEYLIEVAKEHSVKDLIVAGDFWDCDNYSKFSRLTWVQTFQQEIKEVATILEHLSCYFSGIYFCRGNHEKRWIDMNNGMAGMEELFAQTKITEGYQVTLDDHLYLYQNDQKWLMCHPKSFRQTNLSVVKDLAAKHQCNVIGGHGHQFAQGWDRSGSYRIADGGGLFDRDSLDYLRETSCHPMVRNGFYLIQDNELLPFE